MSRKKVFKNDLVSFQNDISWLAKEELFLTFDAYCE